MNKEEENYKPEAARQFANRHNRFENEVPFFIKYRIEADLLSRPHQPPMQSSHISQYALYGGAFGSQVRLISLSGSLSFQVVPNDHSARVLSASLQQIIPHNLHHQCRCRYSHLFYHTISFPVFVNILHFLRMSNRKAFHNMEFQPFSSFRLVIPRFPAIIWIKIQVTRFKI